MTLIIYWKLLIIYKYFLDLNFCKQQTGSMISPSYSEEPSGSFCFCFSLHSLCCITLMPLPWACAWHFGDDYWILYMLGCVSMPVNGWGAVSCLLKARAQKEWMLQDAEQIHVANSWLGAGKTQVFDHTVSIFFFFFIPMHRGTCVCLCKDKCLRLELQITWRPLSIVSSGGHTLYVTTSLEVRSVALCTLFPH